ncbi:hypothetical protein K438DRAFT_1775611 [Mycena galopus ATCC 62051]|nr:hypothetical protein K438DRAFT_1775611 [Mycena galopus ATCC 62051]
MYEHRKYSKFQSEAGTEYSTPTVTTAWANSKIVIHMVEWRTKLQERLGYYHALRKGRSYLHPPSKIQRNLFRQEYYIHVSILAPAKMPPPNNISSTETSTKRLKIGKKTDSLPLEHMNSICQNGRTTAI